MDAPHLSVMRDEVVEAIAPAPGRLLVDATFGAGGYTRAFLEAGASVHAFDRDPGAAAFAEPLARDFPGRLRLTLLRFSELEEGLAEAGVERCDGVAFDLGVSSMQLDEADRGFSFMRDGPLDMRMGRAGASAADLVNTAEESELSRLFWTLGEERQSRRIAARIVRRREEQPFERTLDLAEVVERAVGGRKGAPTHPATRVFQALRIAVNDELAELHAGLDAAERVLAPGGRLVVVTFHSLEDRIVKAYLAERSGNLPAGSRHRPPAERGPAPTFDLLFKGARAPTDAEIAANPRARSAKLRAGVRTDAAPWGDGRMIAASARIIGLRSLAFLTGLFNRRVRGFRLIEIVAFGCLAALVLSVYMTKADAGREASAIAAINRDIETEAERVRLLRAELAHLEQPERIESLTTRYLALAPMSAKRETVPDALPEVVRQGAGAQTP